MKHPIAVVLLFLSAACSSSPDIPTTTGGPLTIVPDEPRAPQEPKPHAAKPEAAKPADGKPADGKAGEGESEVAERKEELRKKERELGYARREREVADIDRQTRAASVALALDKARHDLARAKQDLEVFQKVERPKQIEERRIGHQQSVYSAEHAKDELQELEAMYAAEEFGKATKELVLKRGRRSLELAERNLAVSTTELELLTQHELPQREDELQRKVAEAEAGVRQAELEAQKAQIELELAASRAEDRIGDLEREIAELQQKLAGAGKGGTGAGGGEKSGGGAKNAGKDAGSQESR